MDNVAYVVRCRSTGRRLLVDAAAEPGTLLALVEGTLDLVVTTHRHPDHVGALAAVVEATGARTAAGSEDADALPLPVQQRLEHGDVVRVGDVLLEVVHLRGHTPGSVALVLRDPEGPDHVFTGDSLFPGGVGNTGGEPARFTQLLDDVTERLFDVLADDTVVHPGHGAPTTIGAERPHLAQWRERGW
ncbi:MBL fold metallo-hydrolase [Kineococcus sp. LSe6-4]|uniref:MBL fold metallo-hydrolase n=1 Tax=Kineococcus halophytocola TaxID=3234027 RepID=A0ABV4H193_9ACTN